MNSDLTRRIKEEDSRAFGKFIIILICAGLVGTVLGILSVIIEGSLADHIKEGLSGFLYFTSPYALIAVTIISALTTLILYKKSRSLYQNWDGEDESVSARMETRLGYALWISYLSMILAYFFFAAGISLGSLKNLYHNPGEQIHYIMLCLGLILFLFTFLFEQKMIVNFIKETSPEKKGSVFDISFTKKWKESCDEAEKLMIYRCAYTAYQHVSFTCLLLWVFCIVGSLIWDFGLVPVTVVTIIWGVQTTSYYLETIRLSKKPSTIHE